MDIGPEDALIVVDVQNDFAPGGALPVEDAHQIVYDEFKDVLPLRR